MLYMAFIMGYDHVDRLFPLKDMAGNTHRTRFHLTFIDRDMLFNYRDHNLTAS
jgi:hypothetical protein